MYVEDLVITGTIQESIMKFIQHITAKYECKDVGELDRIINMEVTCTVEGGLFLSQSLYVKDVLEKLKRYFPTKVSKFNDAETPKDNISLKDFSVFDILILSTIFIMQIDKFMQV